MYGVQYSGYCDKPYERHVISDKPNKATKSLKNIITDKRPKATHVIMLRTA